MVTICTLSGPEPIRICSEGHSRQALPAPNQVQSRQAATLKFLRCFFSRAELLKQRKLWKQAGKAVVFTNGCYDLLHPGHVRLLEQARSLGDVLILALNSDASVRRLKGPLRPLISERDRAQ